MSYVYFARCGDYVKIGFSYQPEHRVKRLFTKQLATPPDLDRTRPVALVATIPDCVMKDERRLHEHFAAHRTVGEFFRASPAFFAALDALDYETVRQQRARERRERREAKLVQEAA